jgi:hypothetical protein
MSTPHPSVIVLQKLQDTAESVTAVTTQQTTTRKALELLLEDWEPTGHGVGFELQAEQAVAAVKRLYKDWLQRGENDAELHNQLTWVVCQPELIGAQKEYLGDLGPTS